jgi:hypothetical protein
MGLIRTPTTPQVAIFVVRYDSPQGLSFMQIEPKPLSQKSTVKQKKVSDPQPSLRNWGTNLGLADQVKFKLVA